MAVIHFGLNFPQSYQDLSRRFQDIHAEAQRKPVDPASADAPDWMTTLREECSNPIWNVTLGDLVLHAYPKAAAYLQQQYALLILATELKEAQQESPAVEYQSLNTRSADLEARVTDMNANAKVVFIGSGPQPNSVLAYARHAGQVTGIDCDQEAIQQSQRKIPRPLKSKIRLETANGETFNYGGYSHIVLAAMVPDKKTILQQIRRTANSDAWVIIRDTRGLKGALYPPAYIHEIPGFDKIAEIHGNAQNVTHAVIFRKKPFLITG